MGRLNYYWTKAATPLEASGRRRWPPDIAEKFDAHWLDGLLGFRAESSRESEFLAEASERGIELSKIVRPEADEMLGSAKHFLVGVRDDIKGFSAEGCFDDIDKCDNPPPAIIESMNGCAFGKRQRSKWTVDGVASTRSDIYLASRVSGPRLAIAEYFIVSRRLHDLLAESDLTGFELQPIQRRGSRTETGAGPRPEWHELTVTGRGARPLVMTSPLAPHPKMGRNDCTVCGRTFSQVTESLVWRCYANDAFSESDVQILDKVIDVDGRERTLATGAPLVVSGRFVRVMMDKAVRGFLKLGKEPEVLFWPLLKDTDV